MQSVWVKNKSCGPSWTFQPKSWPLRLLLWCFTGIRNQFTLLTIATPSTSSLHLLEITWILDTNPSDDLWLRPKAVRFFPFFLEDDGEVLLLPKRSLGLPKDQPCQTPPYNLWLSSDTSQPATLSCLRGYHFISENKPLTIDSVTWLGFGFDSDSELTRSTNELPCGWLRDLWLVKTVLY